MPLWTTISSSGQEEVLNPKEIDMSYDRMQSIEDITGYEFGTSSKVGALATDLKKEAAATGAAVNETLTDIGSGIKSGAKLLKYLPYLAIVGGGYYIYTKANA